jgi:hypothetical protein
METRNEAWPPLSLEQWRPTYETLHRYTQVIGKTRLALSPMVNHYWHVALYVTARGLTTSPMPVNGGERTLELELDFLAHELAFRTSDGEQRVHELSARPVAEFYADTVATLHELGVDAQLSDRVVEIPGAKESLSNDRVHRSYDREAVGRWFRALTQADALFEEFRAGFTGKVSPVHFFWGSFDLCVTRFSGRPAPEREGADLVTRESYAEEVISAGFWPGSGPVKEAAFYVYAAPEPAGLSGARVRPAAARYDTEMKEFLLPYEAVRTAHSPRRAVLDFLHSTYEAAAERGGWDRARLERPLIRPEPLAVPSPS